MTPERKSPFSWLGKLATEANQKDPDVKRTYPEPKMPGPRFAGIPGGVGQEGPGISAPRERSDRDSPGPAANSAPSESDQRQRSDMETRLLARLGAAANVDPAEYQRFRERLAQDPAVAAEFREQSGNDLVILCSFKVSELLLRSKYEDNATACDKYVLAATRLIIAYTRLYEKMRPKTPTKSGKGRAPTPTQPKAPRSDTSSSEVTPDPAAGI